MDKSFLSIIYFVAFSHALMLTLTLWQRTVAGNSGRLLAIVIAILAYKMFEAGAEYSGLYQYVPHLLGLLPLMVMGPVFYGYTRQVAGRGKFSAAMWLGYLLPWIAMWLYFYSGDVFQSAQAKVAMYDSWQNATQQTVQLPISTIVILLSVKVHLASYLALSWLELNRFARSALELRSDSSPQQITQLRVLAIAFITLEMIWVGLFIAQQYFNIGTLNYVSEIWLLFIAFIVTAMGFTALKNPAIVFTNEERVLAKTVAEQVKDSNTNVKYINSALPESATDEMAKLIEQTLSSEKLYLEPKLTLTDLAKALNQKSHLISQVISKGLNTNFYQLINSYRVQHATEMLGDQNINWPIERIALESGFNNRVTFNKSFKQIIGCTASEYKKQESKTAQSS
ncbi:MAG: helix-turn-helix transcriptional regulator [Kangiellaceae bacterium]|jgi:AraC-like DNA-binding protein|nr:helix-turn-helix transcriptional regulator [Kangiellaceae bacterium]